uniref:Uncharacterized protein n=1 Tax=Rhizophora mucronata TaxID=61149 RepID=A0A2P2R065_RHIMU
MRKKERSKRKAFTCTHLQQLRQERRSHACCRCSRSPRPMVQVLSTLN